MIWSGLKNTSPFLFKIINIYDFTKKNGYIKKYEYKILICRWKSVVNGSYKSYKISYISWISL